MENKSAIITLLMLITGSFCMAQPSVIIEDFKPSLLNQPGKEYPQVNSQGYARFRIEAPDAKNVVVSLGLGGRGGTTLIKRADNSWMGTTEGPMDEGFHYYHITIDGGLFNDSGTDIIFGGTRWESGIEIPAHDQDIYAFIAVRRKILRHGLLI